MDFVSSINSFALENYMPDLTLFLNISPKAAFERKHGADEGDRMEQLGLEFHRKVYEGYLKLSEMYPERIVKVECGGSKWDTAERIYGILRERKIF